MESLRTFRFLGALALMSTAVNAGIVSTRTTRNSSPTNNRHLEGIDTNTPSFPQELSCTDSYTGFLDLTYTFSMETDMDKDIYPIIENIEGEILLKLSEAVLPCIKQHKNLATDMDVQWETDHPFDRQTLGIVAINSNPRDRPSELTKCVSINNICTVVHGSLTVFLSTDADLENVRYASRYVINEAMKTDFFLTPRIQNLMSISYKGPKIVLPEIQVPSGGTFDNGDGSTIPKTGMTIMSKVIIGALFSAIVGIVAGFVLFRKVFNSQNCFGACDGTGLDRDYIEEAHFYSPSRLREDRPSAPSNDDDDGMQVVSYDIANGLSVINEDSEIMSADTSFAMSTMTGHSSNISRFITGDTSIASWAGEAESVASEKTLHTSNKHRTPIFGKDERAHII